MIFPPTDWLDWTTAEYDVGAPATSLSFERWFRNPVAMAQGAVGAPRIVAGALNIATNSVSGSLAISATVRINLDRKSFFPDIKSNAAGLTVLGLDGASASPSTPGFGLFNENAVPIGYSVAWEYIAT